LYGICFMAPGRVWSSCELSLEVHPNQSSVSLYQHWSTQTHALAFCYAQTFCRLPCGMWNPQVMFLWRVHTCRKMPTT
jgi:hypothetical protein